MKHQPIIRLLTLIFLTCMTCIGVFHSERSHADVTVRVGGSSADISFDGSAAEILFNFFAGGTETARSELREARFPDGKLIHCTDADNIRYYYCGGSALAVPAEGRRAWRLYQDIQPSSEFDAYAQRIIVEGQDLYCARTIVRESNEPATTTYHCVTSVFRNGAFRLLSPAMIGVLN